MNAKISLCLIVGNVEEYIARCLQSFLPLADEVCLVRAIGSQPPDRTIEIARETCGSMPFRFAEYWNAPEHKDWTHVDNFAAARQKSFDLATGDYCFWCDSDDLLESGAEIVRELAGRGGYAAFLFPYKILGQGLCLPRERMMLRNSGHWKHAVHECFEFRVSPAAALEDQRVMVVHLPALEKRGSNSRNLTILESIPEAEMTTGLLYHLHVELLLANEIPRSVEVARRVLARPDLGNTEKYEIFLNLGKSAEDPNSKAGLLHQAFACNPCRREALALLAVNALKHDQPENGLAYARAMNSLPAPTNQGWTHRAPAYGWVGDDIMTQALRANKYWDEAEALRRASLSRAGGPRIALLHATRGRADLAALTRKIWLDSAARPDRVEHIFVCDDDDPEALRLALYHSLQIPAGGGCVAAWNHAAIATSAPILLQLSDDWIPVPRWDDLIAERLGDENEPHVLAISDGLRQDNLLCMAICTRAYYAQDEFLFHPWFKGVHSDNWFTEQAYAREQVIEAKDIVFNHQHYLKLGVEPDETYCRQNAPERYAEGERVITELRARRDWSSVPGFFNFWLWYEFIVKRVRDGDALCEIGVWLGRSIIFLAQELRRQGKSHCKIYAVDHFRGESNQTEHEATVRACGGNIRPAFEANLERCGVQDMITILDGDSAAMAAQLPDATLAFCFVDAAHDCASVKADLAAWRAKVKPGGILSGHDAEWPDVKRAVLETFPDASLYGSVWSKTL